MTSLPCGARLRHSEQSPRHPVIFIRVLASHTYRNLDPPVCDICGTIPDFTAASLREGEALPRGVADLVDVYPTPEGFWDTSKEYAITKECPQCGQLFTYHYYYEFSVGYVEESVWIERHQQSLAG